MGSGAVSLMKTACSMFVCATRQARINAGRRRFDRRLLLPRSPRSEIHYNAAPLSHHICPSVLLSHSLSLTLSQVGCCPDGMYHGDYSAADM